MPQKSIELILLRQWSDCLATPVLLLDNNGVLVYYNSACEKFLDWRFSETGEMDLDIWSQSLSFYDSKNTALPANKNPIQRALHHQEPILEKSYLHLANILKAVTINSIPIMDHTNELVGVIVFLWDAT